MKTRLATLCCLVTLVIASNAHSTEDSLKARDIRLLMHQLDLDDVMRTSLAEQIDLERRTENSELPVGFWDEFEKEVAVSMPEFLERMIPVYDRQFTHEEIRSLTTIYREPVMQKLMRLNPVLSEEAVKASEAWGEEIGMRVALRLEQKPEPFVPSKKIPAQKAGGSDELKD